MTDIKIKFKKYNKIISLYDLQDKLIDDLRKKTDFSIDEIEIVTYNCCSWLDGYDCPNYDEKTGKEIIHKYKDLLKSCIFELENEYYDTTLLKAN